MDMRDHHEFLRSNPHAIHFPFLDASLQPTSSLSSRPSQPLTYLVPFSLGPLHRPCSSVISHTRSSFSPCFLIIAHYGIGLGATYSIFNIGLILCAPLLGKGFLISNILRMQFSRRRRRFITANLPPQITCSSVHPSVRPFHSQIEGLGIKGTFFYVRMCFGYRKYHTKPSFAISVYALQRDIAFGERILNEFHFKFHFNS